MQNPTKRSEIQHRNTKIPWVTFSKASCFVSLLNFQSVNCTISAGFSRFMGFLLARLLPNSVWWARGGLLFQMVTLNVYPKRPNISKHGTKNKAHHVSNPTYWWTAITPHGTWKLVACRCVSFSNEHFQLPFHVNFRGCYIGYMRALLF